MLRPRIDDELSGRKFPQDISVAHQLLSKFGHCRPGEEYLAHDGTSRLAQKARRKSRTPMKPAVFLFSLLLPIVSFGQQTETDFNAFWGKFKTAVINYDKNAVAGLSKFPIGMSYGIRSIKTKAELLRRYRQVFNEQTDAAKCFASKEPEQDSTNKRKYSVACPDAAGNEVVIYEFERAATGWRFVRLDNINE